MSHRLSCNSRRVLSGADAVLGDVIGIASCSRWRRLWHQWILMAGCHPCRPSTCLPLFSLHENVRTMTCWFQYQCDWSGKRQPTLEEKHYIQTADTGRKALHIYRQPSLEKQNKTKTLHTDSKHWKRNHTDNWFTTSFLQPLTYLVTP